MSKIVFLFILVVSGSVLFSIANAYPESKIELFSVTEQDQKTIIKLHYQGHMDPIISYMNSDNSIRVDFPNTFIQSNVEKKAVTAKGLKLAYLITSGCQQSFTGLRVFAEDNRIASFRKTSDTIFLYLRKANNYSLDDTSEGMLVCPTDQKFAPVILDLQNVPLITVVEELSLSAGVNIRFSGILPERFSIDLQASDPMDAIETIAKKTNLIFHRDTDKYWLIGNSTSELELGGTG